MATSLSFQNVRVLSFDIYGTLVDWELGIYQALLASPLKPYLPASRKRILEDFEELEGEVQAEKPWLLESQILAEVLRRYAQRLSVSPGQISTEALEQGAIAFSDSISSWPAFPDTVKAMQKLSERFKLVPLSNIDLDSFTATMSGPLKGVHFDAVYTAQDIGSYKPDTRNFQYLLNHVNQDFGVSQSEIVHVACSLFHDLAPAKKVGLPGVYVDRRGFIGSKLGPQLDETDPDAAQKEYGFAFKVDSLEQFAKIACPS